MIDTSAKRAVSNVMGVQELNTLQSLAMLPLQQVFMKVSLTLPFEKLAMLLGNIRHNLPERPIVHFVSPHRGDGADIIPFEMAYVASTQPGKRVLFINTGANSRHVLQRVQHTNENVTYAPFSNNSRETTFFFTTISAAGNDERILPDTGDFKEIIENLRKMFDMVIIHSDLALSSHMANTLYGLTDGCVLIAEAEHTRLPVMKQLRNMIEMQGGRIVGVVLNKRKFYIPQKLYSFLFRAREGYSR